MAPRRPATGRIVPIILALLSSRATAHAKTVTVHPGESIQAALDRAPAGSTVAVLPGTYHETGWPHAVVVTKDHIHLVGRPRPGQPVVIERAGDQRNGIWASPVDTLTPDNAELPPCGESGQQIHELLIQGFTIKGFPDYGVYIACADRFLVRRNTGVDDRTYSIFPVRSTHGRVTRNATSGTFTDACVYVGESEDVAVDHNTATDCQIGLQLENTRHVTLRSNRATGNTAGLIIDVIAGRETLIAADNLVTGNLIAQNNRPNSGIGSDTGDLVPGIGVVIDGADRTTFSHNVVEQHAFAGMTLVNYCVGAPPPCPDPSLAIDPYPDGNRILKNRFSDNATNVLFLPGTGQGNCFAGNRPDPLQPGTTLPGCP